MPTETASEPFAHLARSMGKMIERMGKDFSGFYTDETWTPNINIYETELALVICVEIAGVVRHEIDLSISENRLHIKGRRESPACPAEVCEVAFADKTSESRSAKARVQVMEIDHGNFRREIELPDNVVQDKITAAYRDGLLWIELPKK